MLPTFGTETALDDDDVDVIAPPHRIAQLLNLIEVNKSSLVFPFSSHKKEDVPPVRRKFEECEDYNEMVLNGCTFKTVQEILDQISLKGYNFLMTGINCENCFKTRDFFLKIGDVERTEICNKFIIENFSEITLYEDFPKIKCDYFLQLLMSNELVVSNEAEVYETVVKWVNHDPEKRNEHIYDLMALVKFPLMAQQFVENLRTQSIVKADQRVEKVIEETLQYFHTTKLNENEEFLTNEHFTPRNYTLPDGNGEENENDAMMCIGGVSDGNSAVTYEEISDDDGKTWKKTEIMNLSRSYFGATLCEGDVYIVGGKGPDGLLKSCLKYDPVNQSWMRIPELPTARWRLGLTYSGSKLYVTGGTGFGHDDNTAICLDINDMGNGWKSVSKMTEGRCGHVSCSAAGHVFCIGGFKKNSCERYDDEINRWRGIAPMECKRSFAAGCYDGMSYIYVAGGYNLKDCLSSIERYNVFTNQWTFFSSPMTVGRDSASLTYSRGYLYLIGGRDKLEQKNSNVHKYDEETDS
ncbi:Kelch-like protein 1 [Nymphon striatum]|nr:Kelch-like protein 1 [Nymphon striatum]